MATARAKKLQPQSGTRPAKRRTASDDPIEAAKTYATFPEGKEDDPGGVISRRASGSERKGLACITRSFNASEEANPIIRATNPASAAQRPVLPPSAASAPSNASQTAP